VIVFTDEPGQSYLMPTSQVGKSYNTNNTITQEKLLKMLETITGVKLYAFTDIFSANAKGGWAPLTAITSGTWAHLTDDPWGMLNYLEGIITTEACD